MPRVAAVVAFLILAVAPLSGGGAATAGSTGVRSPAAPAPVAAPRFVRNISTGETGWFSSPGLVDLNGDRRLELVAPFYSTFVFDAKGRQLGKGTATKGRVYAPGAVADLDGDGRMEIVVGGNEGTVAAYELRGGRLQLEPGWPASTCSGGQCPEARGLAAADLDGDGRTEVVVTTTNTSPTGAQVFVFGARGSLYRPKGAPATAWPRYNRLRGAGNDADFNGAGNRGYGAYGENVGIGNLDDDAQLEIVVTFDNHQINVFNHDGTSVLASPWFRNRESQHAGRRLGWGQFIRWLDPAVEARHYHEHAGPWPDVRKTMWLQWTDSPPSIGDLDGDGRNEVIGLPNAEQKEPYETQAYAFMVLDGAYGDGSRSARRHPGFTTLPRSGKPAVRLPGTGIPRPGSRLPRSSTSPAIGGRRSSPRCPTASSMPSARRASGSGASTTPGARRRRSPPRSWPPTSTGTASPSSSSAPTRWPRAPAGWSCSRRRESALHDIRLPRQGKNGNGIGVPAAPSIGDLDGDGTLEIVLSTFDHGLDVFHVPGSGTNLLPWPTGRGSLLRNGTGPATAP